MTEPTAAPVVVTPIAPEQSRTLRLTWLTTVWTTIIGFLPDLIELLFYLLTTDRQFAAAVESLFPRTIRYFAMSIIIGQAQRHRILRNQTVAPIIGTPAAESLPLRREV